MPFWKNPKESFWASYNRAHQQSLDSLLCPECRSMTLQPSTEQRLVREYPNNKALYESAQQCTICLFILYRNIAKNRVQSTAHDDSIMNQVNVNTPIKLFQVFENGQYNLKWVADATIVVSGDAARAGIYYSETFGGLVANNTPGFGQIVCGRKVEHKAQSKHNQQRIRTWLHTCLHSHSKCKTESPCLPTRVIDVGLTNRKLKLLITDRKLCHSYVALSYGWGKSPNLRLTADILMDFQSSIPFRKIPKTIQDAVTVTRQLGMQYLWVDAICIIQDSAEDWACESAMMGDIYSDATVVIKGASSADCQDGLYMTRQKDKFAPFNLRMELENGSIDLVNLRVESLVVKEPLDSRGWCLQESWLARRTVVFGSRQIWWECRTCTLTESESPLLEGKLGPAPFYKPIHGTMSDFNISDTDVVESDAGRNQRYTWEDVVGGLCSRTFTYPDDNLAALSGIAKLFATTDHAGDVYIAGLWKSELPQNLLWTAMPHKSDDRPLAWHAPSWTWASLSDSGVIWERSHKTDNVYASVISYEITPRGPDIYGKVNPLGFITLHTQLKPAYRFRREGGNALRGWLLSSHKPAGRRPRVNPSVSYQAWQSQFDETIGQCSLDSRDVDEDMDDTYMVYCARITTKMGLILELVNKRGEFRRRGTFDIHEDKVEEWWGSYKRESVIII